MPSSYYDFGPVLSHNAVYNFILGARGLGKTYGAKRKAIRDFINKGDQFIYLRRYSTELKSVKTTFMADIAHEFPQTVFRLQGEEIQARPKNNDQAPWRVMCYFVALSKAQQKKSVAYPDVKTIIYDEFIIDRGAVHYLPNEGKAFNDFYSTVDRYKDKTRVLFLANTVSIMNPYFIEWDIAPKRNDEWVIPQQYRGFIVAHFPRAEAFVGEVFKTRFGQFIQNSEYADYAVGSEFSDNSNTLIAPKTSTARYQATIETKTGTFALWVDSKPSNGPHFYVTAKRPKGETLWTLLPERMDESRVLIEYSDKTLQYLRAGYSRARVFFDRPQTRNAFIGIYKR
jgi:hypothetical protein